MNDREWELRAQLHKLKREVWPGIHRALVLLSVLGFLVWWWVDRNPAYLAVAALLNCTYNSLRIRKLEGK